MVLASPTPSQIDEMSYSLLDREDLEMFSPEELKRMSHHMLHVQRASEIYAVRTRNFRELIEEVRRSKMSTRRTAFYDPDRDGYVDPPKKPYPARDAGGDAE